MCVSRSVMSKSLRPHGLGSCRLLCLWDFPDKNAGVSCHSLLQRIFPIQGLIPGSPELQANTLLSKLLGKPQYFPERAKNQHWIKDWNIMDCSIAKLEGAWQWRNAFKILREPKLLHAIYKYEGSGEKDILKCVTTQKFTSQILFLMQLLKDLFQ